MAESSIESFYSIIFPVGDKFVSSETRYYLRSKRLVHQKLSYLTDFMSNFVD